MEQPKANTEEIKQKIPESQEVRKEITIEDIDEKLVIEEGILGNLNDFAKDDIFKDIDFENNIKLRGVGVVDEKFDEVVYGKATVEQKILNFVTFGLAKKDLGFIKSKERGLLNQDIFNKEIEGKEIEVGQNKEERGATEKLIGGFHKELNTEDLGKRQITKKFEFVDGKIIKIVQASRTEQGMIDEAGRLRDEKIKEADNLGADIIKSKEQLEKHFSDKGRLENLKYLSAEGKEDLRIKIAEEEANLGNLIKDKETELRDKLSVFKEPLGERYEQTNELLSRVFLALGNVKDQEQYLKEKVREIDDEIKLIEKSGILAESKKSIIKELKLNMEESTRIFNATVEFKTNLEARLKILTVNKKELADELSKINKIGKTKKEIAEEIKAKKEVQEEGGKKVKERKEGEHSVEDMAEDWNFMEGQKINKEAKEAQADNEDNVLYDPTGEKDKVDINEIIESYLTKKDSQKKKDKGFFDGFVKNVFSFLFESKKANIPLTKKNILKGVDNVFKKNQKEERKFKSAK